MSVAGLEANNARYGVGAAVSAFLVNFPKPEKAPSPCHRCLPAEARAAGGAALIELQAERGVVDGERTLQVSGLAAPRHICCRRLCRFPR